MKANMAKGMLLIISGPSGSGKGTVVQKLIPSEEFALSISVTTRKPRPGEVDGKDYFFIDVAEFERMREQGELLEHALFVGNMYGTPKKYVLEQIELGKTVILEIEVNGALQIKDKFDDCVLIFLMPPTMAELKNRLTGRATESEETIDYRLRRACEEIQLISKYDYLVINDQIPDTIDDIKLIVGAERLKPMRNSEEIKKFMEE